MEKLTIIHVIDHKTINALTEYAITLSRLLRDHGHDVRTVSIGGTVVEKELGRSGFHPQAIGGGVASAWGDLRALAGLVRNGADVINAFGPRAQSLSIGSVALSRTRIPIVRTRIFIHQVRGDVLQRIFYRRYIALLIVTNAAERTRTSEKLGLPWDRTAVLYGGVDTARYVPGRPSRLRESLGLGREDFLAALIARLSHIKGHEVFLRALASACRENPRIHGIVAGPEDCLPAGEIADLARRLGVEKNVHFLGFVDEITDVMSGIDVGIISSIGSEEHSRVGLEYMAMGKPIIGTRVGAVPDIIREGFTGYVVEPGDPRGLADKILLLARDRASAGRMGERARQMAEDLYSFPAFLRGAEELYGRVARDHGGLRAASAGAVH